MSLDFSAAFDTLSVDVLVAKLRKIGAHPDTVKLFVSYLTGGTQAVEWNGKLSDLLPVSSCCRQGSLLGPMLFLLASSDVPLSLAFPSAYADDAAGADTNVDVLQPQVSELEKAAAAAGLRINGAKSQLLIVGRKISDSYIMVDGCKVDAGTTLDLLGMRFDWRLSTDEYVDSLIVDLKRRLAVLRLLRPRLPKKAFAMVCQGILIGKVSTYAAHYAPVRLNESEPVSGRLRAVQTVLNDLYRLMSGYWRSDHVTIRDLLKATGLPTLNEMAAREAVTIIWESYTDPAAPLASILDDLRPSTTSRAHSMCKLNAPDPSNVLLASGVRLWNLHATSLAALKTKASVKNYVKTKIWPSLPV